jgi:hypothetical protein
MSKVGIESRDGRVLVFCSHGAVSQSTQAPEKRCPHLDDLADSRVDPRILNLDFSYQLASFVAADRLLSWESCTSSSRRSTLTHGNYPISIILDQAETEIAMSPTGTPLIVELAWFSVWDLGCELTNWRWSIGPGFPTLGLGPGVGKRFLAWRWGCQLSLLPANEGCSPLREPRQGLGSPCRFRPSLVFPCHIRAEWDPVIHHPTRYLPPSRSAIAITTTIVFWFVSTLPLALFVGCPYRQGRI